ncbi:MAG TPA: hypothetical protein DD791_08035 [Syntrophomonas sp.]|jgi:hypothetical protein|nr:hypothetical protein [Syntrophomonas sp.]
MALKQRLYNLEKMMVANKEEPYVIHLKDEVHTPAEIEAARQQAIAEGREVILIGKLAEWSK